jgi:hypothetical protein
MQDGRPSGLFGLSVRPIVILIIVAQVLIPTVLLAARHLDPTRGQLPFGWQMHTTCWGSDAPICDR